MINTKKLLPIFLLTLTGITTANAEQVNITLKPNQCVSVHQGEQCFVDIELDWQAAHMNDYCLYVSDQDSPLQCWSNAQSGHFAREISTNKNLTFSIKVKNTSNISAQQTLKMAWVYKKTIRSRMTWRLF